MKNQINQLIYIFTLFFIVSCSTNKKLILESENYKKLQNQYVDLIIDNYSNAKVMWINDDNIDEIIKEVSQLINYGK
jgi:hypothetical protein